MKITNETEWDTAPMRRIIARVALDEANVETRRRLKITVKYGRRPRWVAVGGESGHSHGNAYIGTSAWPGSIRIFVSRDTVPDSIDFAMVAAHEIAHARGQRHDLIRNSPRYERVAGHRERYAWADAIPFGKVVPKVKAPPSIDERRQAEIALAERRLKEWTTRLRRAETGVKKYERRIKEVRRRQAASSRAVTAASRNEAVITGPGNLRTIAAETVEA